MAVCPLYSRYRGFFDDTHFGSTILGGDLFDPTFYQQWFNMQVGNRQPASRQSTGVCPLRKQTGAYPFRQQNAYSRLAQPTGTCPFRQQTVVSQLSQKTTECPFRQQTSSPQLVQKTRKGPFRKKTGTSKLPQQTGTSPLRQQLGTLVTITPGKFTIRVNTRNISPQEITVKTEGNCVVIHGKHAEESGGRGYHVQREFTRRYELPDDVDPETAKCDLMDNGDLAIEATRREAPKPQEKPVSIEVERTPERDDEESSV